MPVKICDNLRVLRARERYSMEDIAEIIGVSRQSVAKWESGESLPDIDKCVKLAKLYKVTLDDLVNATVEELQYEDDEEKGKYCFGVVKLQDGKILVPEKANKDIYTLCGVDKDGKAVNIAVTPEIKDNIV